MNYWRKWSKRSCFSDFRVNFSHKEEVNGEGPNVPWKSHFGAFQGVVPRTRVCQCSEKSAFKSALRLACSVASVKSNSVRPRGLQPARLLCPRDSPGKTSGVGCHALLQGIFPTQGQNPGLHIAGGFFTIWGTGKSPEPQGKPMKLTRWGSDE